MKFWLTINEGFTYMQIDGNLKQCTQRFLKIFRHPTHFHQAQKNLLKLNSRG
jgi:hypothetical protein